MESDCIGGNIRDGDLGILGNVGLFVCECMVGVDVGSGVV